LTCKIVIVKRFFIAYEKLMSSNDINRTKFSKILVPIDGSPSSLTAALYATDLAKIYDSKITLLSVVPSQIRHGDSSGVFGMVTPHHLSQYKKEAGKWFNQIFDEIKEKNFDINQIRTDVITTPMSIVGAIVDYAEKESTDIIILGKSGSTGFKKILLGSTASGVVTYAHCNVLVVK
jgi:nucleotide-binding universal stress UspA family protein